MRRRQIGIVHRVKRTTDDEARPTLIAINNQDGKGVTTLELESDQDELDFVLGRFPTKYQKAGEKEALSGDFAPHHVKVGEKSFRVPASYEGLMEGDDVVMPLGGSGDRLASALSRKGEEIGAYVYRIPPYKVKELRGDTDKEDDRELLSCVDTNAQWCQPVTRRERDMALLCQLYRERMDAMKARIACEQRLRQRFIGWVFMEENLDEAGAIEDVFKEVTANDTILQNLYEEEKKVETRLRKHMRTLPVWLYVLSDVEGVGEMLAARIVSAVQDINRFETAAKLKAFCGVHVMNDGKFARRRRNQLCNWHNDARQGLYLLGEQFNRRPDSVWGQELRKYKARLREKHPEVEIVDGKKRYTDGHIHKMATWRTITRFTEWFFKAWKRIETESAHADKPTSRAA